MEKGTRAVFWQIVQEIGVQSYNSVLSRGNKTYLHRRRGKPTGRPRGSRRTCLSGFTWFPLNANSLVALEAESTVGLKEAFRDFHIKLYNDNNSNYNNFDRLGEKDDCTCVSKAKYVDVWSLFTNVFKSTKIV